MELTNLERDGLGIVRGDRAIFLANEANDGRDYNGDGGQSDLVLHVREFGKPSTHNLKLAGFGGFIEPGFDGSNELIGLPVIESDQGHTDLNGDGDTDDGVVHVVELASRTVTNLRIAGHGVLAQDDWMIFMASEFGQGIDFNGNGSLFDTSFAVYHRKTRTMRVLGLAPPTFFFVPQPPVLKQSAELAAFLVGEEKQGEDLNGDGDEEDWVLHVYDAVTRSVRNLGFGVTAFGVEGSLVFFCVPETAMDLNGDGDIRDLVPHVYDARTQMTRNLQLAVGTTGLPGEEDWFALGGDLVAVLVWERGQGSRDLNGDRDILDHVLHVYDAATGLVRNLGLAPRREGGNEIALGIVQRTVAFQVNEVAQGPDLNGDGDVANESVLHTYSADTGVVRNLGLVVTDLVAGNREMAFRSAEVQQNADLNGDGDMSDLLLFVHDPTTGFLRNSRSTAFPDYLVQSGVALFLTSEPSEGHDINGDGDASDVVGRIYTPASDRLFDPTPDIVSIQGLSQSRWALVGAFESGSVSQDLNNDGDLLDQVLHLVSVDEITRGAPRHP